MNSSDESFFPIPESLSKFSRLTAACVFHPMWNKNPLHQRKLPKWFLRILANHGHGLGRRNVVAQAPLLFTRDAIEVFIDDLLSPG
jgi:hypothetical protein